MPVFDYHRFEKLIRSPSLRDFFDMWNGLRHGRAGPSRADFRPEEFAEWWPSMFLVELDTGDSIGGFRYRLVGTRLENWVGRNLTGAMIEQPTAEGLGVSCYHAYRKCWDQRIPGYELIRVKSGLEKTAEFERLVLPLCDLEGRMEMLLGCARIEDFVRQEGFLL